MDEKDEKNVIAILDEIYGKNNYNKKKIETHLNEKSKNNIIRFLQNHSFEETLKKFKKKYETDKIKGTLEGYIQRYGEIEGLKKYKEKNKKLSVGLSSLLEKGMTYEEAIKIRENHKKKSINNKENFIERYGEIEGNEKYEKYSNTFKSRSVRCKEYWLERGYSEKEAKIQISLSQVRDWNFFKEKGWTKEEYEELCKRKTFQWTEEGYIQRYGEIEGKIRYYYDRRKSSTLKYWCEKLGVEEGKKRYEEINIKKGESKFHPGRINSFIEKEIILELIPFLKKMNIIFYAGTYNESFRINFPSNEFGLYRCFPDLKIQNLLIEIDGVYWHSKLKTIERDEQKDILNSRLGYKILRITDKEFLQNKKETILKIQNFIEKNLDKDFIDEN